MPESADQLPEDGAEPISDAQIAANVIRADEWEETVHTRRRSHPRPLIGYERRVTSQNGEDGMITALLSRLGSAHGYAVEFGSGDGAVNCTRNLLDGGYRLAWIDGDADTIAAARDIAPSEDLVLLSRRLTTDNLVPSLDDLGVPEEPDLVVIDVDGNDYWLWQRLAERFRPRALIVEYNAAHEPPDHWVMPYDPGYEWDGSAHFGASLNALAQLGEDLGYRLVGCDSSGTNAFFVRHDLAELAAEWVGTAEDHYAPPSYAPASFGHRLVGGGAQSPAPIEDAARVVLTEFTPARATPPPGGRRIYGTFRISNGTEQTLISQGDNAVHVAYRWKADSGRTIRFRGRRFRIPRPIRPGESSLVGFSAVAPHVFDEAATLEVGLAQKGVGWLTGAFADEPAPVRLARDEESPN